MLSTFYGAINAPNTGYWIDGQADLMDGRWQDVTTVVNRFISNDPYGHQTRGQIQNEWSFFAKDDYKLTSRLTLNIGVRYDFTGSPYLTEGLTNRIVGDGLGLFGPSRFPVGPFSTWLTPATCTCRLRSGRGESAAMRQGSRQPNGLPASNCDQNLMSKVIFVGPNTDNPDKTLVPQRGRSVRRSVSWQLPWFGEARPRSAADSSGPTVRPDRHSAAAVERPGADALPHPLCIQSFATRAANLTDLPLAVPATPVGATSGPVFASAPSNAGLVRTLRPRLQESVYRQLHPDDCSKPAAT